MSKYQKLYEDLNKAIYYLKTEIFDVVSRIELFNKDIEISNEKIKNLKNEKAKLLNIYEILKNYKKIIKDNLKNNIKSIGLTLLVVASIIGLMEFCFGVLSLDNLLTILKNYIVFTIGGVITYHFVETRKVRRIYKDNIDNVDALPNMIKELDEMITEIYKLIDLSDNALQVLVETKNNLDAELSKAKIYSGILLDKLEAIMVQDQELIEQSDNDYDKDNSITDIIRLVREKNPIEKNKN